MDKIKSLKMKHCSNAFKSPNESSGEVDYYSDIAKCEGIDLGWNACHEFMIGQAQSEFDKNLESTKVISGTYAWGLDMVKDSKLDYAHEGFLAGARWQHQQDFARRQKAEADLALAKEGELEEYKDAAKYQRENAAIRELLDKALNVMESSHQLVGRCNLYLMPINVRELDGSISQQRPISNEGRVYKMLEEAISEIQEGLRKMGVEK